MYTDMMMRISAKGAGESGGKGFGKNLRSNNKNGEFLVGLACDPGMLVMFVYILMGMYVCIYVCVHCLMCVCIFSLYYTCVFDSCF